MLRLTLPYPPSANNLFRNAGKRRVKTAEYAAWQTLAGMCIRDSHRLALDSYSISICVRRPDRRRRDLANLEKAVSDLLVAHGVVKDDSLCERITMQWDAGLEAECVVIVQPFEEGMAA